MKSSDYDTKYIKALDGIRALAIIIIVWFHFWQQSWLIPVWGIINLDFIPRYGYLLVDLMILLSGFCLFIPYARSIVYKEKIPSTRDFYVKRIARIFPSYFLAMLVAFIFITFKDYWFNPFFIKDTIMHLLFIQNWSIDTLVYTQYMVVSWTVAVEVQFYLIFPFIAKRFVKRPFVTYLLMYLVGAISLFFIIKNANNDNMAFYVNHFLTFIPVFANGMLGCLLYTMYTKKRKRTVIRDILFTIISIGMIIIYIYLCKSIGNSNVKIWQLSYRMILSIVFMVFVVSTCLSAKIYKYLFSNKVMRFISIISFNLYLYHQFICVKLKEFRIPYFEGNIPPNMTGDLAWKWKYTILCIVISVIVAIIITYLFEKPIAKYIRKKYKVRE